MSQKDGHFQAHKAMDNPASQGRTLFCQVSTSYLRTWPQQRLKRMDTCRLARLWTTQLHKDGLFSVRYQLLLNWAHDHNKSRKDGHLQAHKAVDNPTSQGRTLFCQVSTSYLRTWPQQHLRRMDTCRLTRLQIIKLQKDGHFSARFQLILNWAHDRIKSRKNGHLLAHKAIDNLTSQKWTLFSRVSTFT